MLNVHSSKFLLFIIIFSTSKQLLELTWITEESKNYIYVGISKEKPSKTQLLLTLTNTGISLYCNSPQTEMYDLERSPSKLLAECDFSQNCRCISNQCETPNGIVYKEVLKFKEGPNQALYELPINCEKQKESEISEKIGYGYKNYTDVDGFFGIGYPKESKFI